MTFIYNEKILNTIVFSKSNFNVFIEKALHKIDFLDF
jgi:hypothetical protein